MLKCINLVMNYVYVLMHKVVVGVNHQKQVQAGCISPNVVLKTCLGDRRFGPLGTKAELDLVGAVVQ